jgi:hypothetical protein
MNARLSAPPGGDLNGCSHDGLSILAIGAHPDDVGLGCGASLAHYASMGARISVLVFSHGRRGALDHDDRVAETSLAFAKIGVKDVVVLDFPDTGLGSMHCELVQVIEEYVASRKPAVGCHNCSAMKRPAPIPISCLRFSKQLANIWRQRSRR